MGLEVLLDLPVEKGADLVKDFLNKGFSSKLELDCGRDWPSSYLTDDAKKNPKVESKVCEILTYLMRNYAYDGDKDRWHDDYLNVLIVSAIVLRVDYTPVFLADVKAHPIYNKLESNTRYNIKAGIVTFSKLSK